MRTIALYPVFRFVRAGLFSTPIFFFFLAERVGARDALTLEALYFALVVVLEVPSGYLADRVGRRVTLILSQSAGVLGGALFFFAQDLSSPFWILALGQALFAMWHACYSGTDAALLYDALEEQGREDEFGTRESSAQFYGRTMLGIASLVGGFIATRDLALPYLLMAASSGAGLLVLLFMKEPARVYAGGAAGQVRKSVRALSDKTLLWALLVGVALIVFAHVPYELFQPYVALAFADVDVESSFLKAPVVAGVLMAVNSWTSGLGARVSIPLSDRLGENGKVWAILLSFLSLCALILVLGIALHPVVAALLAFRSLSPGIAGPLTLAIVQPRVTSDLRSTLWSLRSMAGRLLFAGCAALMGFALGDGDATWARLSPIFMIAGVSAAVVFALLLIFRPRVHQATARSLDLSNGNS